MKKHLKYMTFVTLLYSFTYSGFVFMIYFHKQDNKLIDTIALLIGSVASITYSSVVLFNKNKASTVFTEICFALSSTFTVWFFIHSVFQFWNQKTEGTLQWIILVFSPLASIMFWWLLHSTRDCCRQWVDFENRLK